MPPVTLRGFSASRALFFGRGLRPSRVQPGMLPGSCVSRDPAGCRQRQPVDDHEDSLHRARQAYAAEDWRGAADSFDAVAPHRLTADDLAAYADAVWWLGRAEDARRLYAAACDALVAESRPADAAGVPSVSGSPTFREATRR